MLKIFFEKMLQKNLTFSPINFVRRKRTTREKTDRKITYKISIKPPWRICALGLAKETNLPAYYMVFTL